MQCILPTKNPVFHVRISLIFFRALMPQAEFSLKHFWCLICIFLQLAELHADTLRQASDTLSIQKWGKGSRGSWENSPRREWAAVCCTWKKSASRFLLPTPFSSDDGQLSVGRRPTSFFGSDFGARTKCRVATLIRMLAGTTATATAASEHAKSTHWVLCPLCVFFVGFSAKFVPALFALAFC